MNEQEKFLQDTEADLTKTDVLEQSLIPDSEKSEEGELEGTDEGTNGEQQPKNRRERRLMERLEAEKQSSAFLAGKLEARTEASKAVTEEADYLKAIERIYGTDTPEAQIATDLLKKAIVGARDDAQERAYERIKDERTKENDEVAEAEDELDSMIENIEDEYGISLTAPQEAAFFTLLEKMSPKDKQGNVTEYADPDAVWEVFSEKLSRSKGSDNRAKDMSSRSMTQSGSSKESNLEVDATARFLQEQGII